MALAGLAPHLPDGGARAIKLRGVLADALRLFARGGGGALDDLVRLLGRLPEDASRIAEAGALALEVAQQLLGAMATDPLLRTRGAPFDPAQWFADESGRARVSVVSLAGLETDATRTGFVHQIQMALMSWLARQPNPALRLYVLDEAQAFAPAKEMTSARRSALALIGRRKIKGLAMVVAAPARGAVDPALLAGCATQIEGAADGSFTLSTDGGAPVAFAPPPLQA